MNEIVPDAPRPEAARGLRDTLLAQQAATPAQADEMARNFLARVQRDIDEQVDLRVQQLMTRTAAPTSSPGISNQDKELILGSLGIGVGLTAVVGIFGVDIAVAIIGWLCILLVNVAWVRRR